MLKNGLKITMIGLKITIAMNNLFDRWQQLLKPYTSDENLTHDWFAQINQHYAEPIRHYHTLTHLEALFAWSDTYHAHLHHQNVVTFAIFYHDIIYNPQRSDNEEQSAKIAQNQLISLTKNPTLANRVAQFILATKTHAFSDLDESYKSDMSYFLDFDLSILGAANHDYQLYSQAIRQEYAHYPDAIYKVGRMNVLKYFLVKPRIYLTQDFQENLEKQARENLQGELELLESSKI